MLAPHFYPAYGAECLVNSKLALAFLNRGWELTVLSHIDKEYNFFDSSESSEWNRLRDISIPIKSVESWSNKAVLDKIWVFAKTNHITNGMLWVEKCIKVCEQLIEREKFSVIISRAIPEYAHHAAMYLSKKYKIPWIANWNDPVPNSKFPRPGGLGSDAPLKTYTKRFLKAVYENASWHTFPSARLKKYITGYIGGDIENKSSIIPHIALNRFTQIGKENSNRFVMCHVGGLSQKTRNPLYLLQPASNLIRENKICGGTTINFIGNIPQEITEIARNLGIQRNVLAEGWNSYEYCLSKLSTAVVSVLIEEDTSEGIYLPSKISDYLQVGNPILALGPKNGTVRDYIDKCGGGIYAHCSNQEEVSSAIESIYEAWKQGILYDRFKTEVLYDCFNEDTIIKQYKQVFDAICLS
jgi:hypothetical protein